MKYDLRFTGVLLISIIIGIFCFLWKDTSDRIDRLNGDMSINFVHEGPATKGYNTYTGSIDSIREFLNRQQERGVNIKVVGFEKMTAYEFVCLFVVE